MKRKIIFSDLHLAGGGKNDQFLEDDFAACLSSILKEPFHGTTDIIYAGDIYDLREDSYGNCVGAHVPVAMAIEQSRRDGGFVRGNHDRGIPAPEILDLPGDIRVLHGHQFDDFNAGRFRFIGDTFSSAIGWFEKRGLGSVRIAKWVRRLRNLGSRRKMHKYVRQEKLTVLIHGHTHHGVFLNKNGQYLVNTGCWVDPREMHYVELLYYPTYTQLTLFQWTIRGRSRKGTANLLL